MDEMAIHDACREGLLTVVVVVVVVVVVDCV